MNPIVDTVAIVFAELSVESCEEGQPPSLRQLLERSDDLEPTISPVTVPTPIPTAPTPNATNGRMFVLRSGGVSGACFGCPVGVAAAATAGSGLELGSTTSVSVMPLDSPSLSVTCWLAQTNPFAHTELVWVPRAAGV